MTSANVFKRFTFLCVFVLMLGASHAAYAFGQPVNDSQANLKLTDIINTLKQGLLGGSGGTGQGQDMTVGKDANGNDIKGGQGSYDSIPAYFENVWWPRMIKMNQVMSGVEDQKDAMSMSHNARLVDGKSANDWNQGIKAATADLRLGYMGGESITCEGLSTKQSENAAGYISDDFRNKYISTSLQQMSGDPDAPGAITAEGPTSYNAASVKEAIAAGVLLPNGNGGANKDLGGSDSGKANWHTNIDTLLKPYVLQSSDPEKQNYAQYTDMFIARLFPNRALTPIRAGLLQAMDGDTYQVLNQQDAYKALMGTFERPFHQARAERTEQSGLAATEFLKAALDRAGMGDIPTVAAEFLGEGGTLSKAAMDKILYSIYTRDPKTAEQAFSFDYRNIARFDGISQLSHTALLYDIREEIKNTNMLLGALGRIMGAPLYDDVQKTTATLNGKNP